MNKDNMDSQNKTLEEKKKIKEDILDFWKTNQVSPGSLVWLPNRKQLIILTRTYLLIHEYPNVESTLPEDFFHILNHPQKRGGTIRGLIFESPTELEEYEINKETDIFRGSLIFEFLVEDKIIKSYMLDIWSDGIGEGLYHLANNEEPYIYE
jgi:hypothetical protein